METSCSFFNLDQLPLQEPCSYQIGFPAVFRLQDVTLVLEPGGDDRRGGVCQIRSLVTPAVASPSEAASNLKMEMKCIVP